MRLSLLFESLGVEISLIVYRYVYRVSRSGTSIKVIVQVEVTEKLVGGLQLK